LLSTSRETLAARGEAIAILNKVSSSAQSVFLIFPAGRDFPLARLH
jgi:hypothetical protein